MKLLRFSLTLLFALYAMFVMAQQQTDKKSTADSPSASQSPMMMAKPGPEMQKFADMVLGTWTVHESHDAGDMGPAGTSTGTATFRQGPGDLSVIEDFSSNGSMGPVKGMGVFWWEPKQQAYKGLWCDSMTPVCYSSTTAKWEGEKLVAQGESEMPDGGKMFMKDEYTDITPTSFTFTMYGGPNANTLKKFMTIKYTRSSQPEAKTKPAK
jgi:hypothetical protein